MKIPVLGLSLFPFPVGGFPFSLALQGPIQLQLALSVEFFRYTIGHSLFDVVTLLLPLSLKAAIKFKDFNISISENRGILLKNHSLFEMGTNKPVTLILLSNPNLVDILGDTDFDFESSYYCCVARFFAEHLLNIDVFTRAFQKTLEILSFFHELCRKPCN